MEPREVFRQYREERRRSTYPGIFVNHLPRLTRHVPATRQETGFVVFADFTPQIAGAAIDEQILFFQRMGQQFEWKVHDFDSPPALKEMLEARGFRPQDQEAFLVLRTSEWRAPSCVPDGIRVEKISDLKRIQDYVTAEKAIWGEVVAHHMTAYRSILEADPERLSLYCAYEDGAPVGMGRVTFPPGEFADLNGGAVIPRLRGRGIFTALLDRRIVEARERGYRWIAVDAAPMSRPILLRKGFQHVCWTYPMTQQ